MARTQHKTPEGVLRLSNSKLGTWRDCPHKFYYKYELGLRAKAKALPLERGTWLHSLLEVHYSNDPKMTMPWGKRQQVVVGTDWRKAHKVLTKKFNLLFDEEKEDLGDLPTECARIFTSYLARYAKQDQKWRVIATELDELITLESGLIFQVIIDLIVEEPDGGLWIVDHKTVGNFMPVDFMLLDAQLARYFEGARILGYKNLRGIIFNEVRTKAPTLPKLIHGGTQLEKRANLQCDVYTYYRELKRHGLEYGPHKAFLQRLASQQDQWFRRTRLPKDQPLVTRLMEELEMGAAEIRAAQAKKAFPRSPSRDCTWKCEFLHACQVSLMGGDITDIVKQRFTTAEERDL